MQVRVCECSPRSSVAEAVGCNTGVQLGQWNLSSALGRSGQLHCCYARAMLEYP
jgi:hypothetical protein